MDIEELFPNMVNPDCISVYVGRVIRLDENFESNGILYVDLCNPNDTDLDKGAKTSNKAVASFALRNLYKCWENPPEIKSKALFDGSMSFTSSGDFHLRNYCLDMYTLTYLTQISTILEILFPVMPTVPPPLISIDTTPFPGQAVSINVSVAAKEVINESIQSVLKDIKSDSESSSNLRTRMSLTRDSGDSPSYDDSGLINSIVESITSPLDSILDFAVKPYYTFIKCIKILFELYKQNLDDIADILFPITIFSDLNSDGTVTVPSQKDLLSVKDSLKIKIDNFNSYIDNNITSIIASVEPKVKETVRKPIEGLVYTINTKIDDIINPIKDKIVSLILGYVKEPLAEITGFIAMSIQPVISSLPSVVQLIVKLALKKVLQLLLGTPIRIILAGIVDGFNSIITSTVKLIKSEIAEIITTALTTLTNPLIEGLQKELVSLMPFPYNMMDKLLIKLEEIKDPSLFPAIYTENDPVRPYKDFDEINWSNPSELKSMILSLIQDVVSDQNDANNDNNRTNLRAKSTLDIPPDKISVKVSKESIYTIESDHRKVQGALQEALCDTQYEDETIEKGEPLKDGTLEKKDGTLEKGAYLFYKNFSSKDSFLPYFEQTYEPVTIPASIGEGVFAKAEPHLWLTNGVAYIDSDENGSTVRYVCYYNKDGVVIGKEEVLCLFKGNIETRILDVNKIYYSTTIPHIKINEADPETGVDLVPLLDDGGNIIPVQTNKTVTESTATRNIGDFLYKDINDNDKEKTFNEIANLYHIPTRVLSREDIILNFIEVLQTQEIKSTTSSIDITKTHLYKCLFNNIGYTYSVYYPLGENKTLLNLGNFADVMIRYDFSSVNEEGNGRAFIEIKNPYVDSYPDMSFKVSLIFNVIKNKVSTVVSFFVNILPNETTEQPSSDNAVLDCCVDSSDQYYSWMVESLEDKEVDVSSLQNEEASLDLMTDMLVHSVQAIGQDEGFDSGSLFDAIASKVTSMFNKIADAMSGIDPILTSFLERADSLKDLSSVMDKIDDVGKKVKEISESAKPALEATAKAASMVAVQSCSMSQSATGKDFNFTSGNNYDLSTTTESKSQLPYCKELSREKLLEPNCKVIVLAMGAGRQNLFAVDVLT